MRRIHPVRHPHRCCKGGGRRAAGGGDSSNRPQEPLMERARISARNKKTIQNKALEMVDQYKGSVVQLDVYQTNRGGSYAMGSPDGTLVG